MNAKPNYDTAYIRVESKTAGDYGFARMSGVHWPDDTHLREMTRDIERHVDGVDSANVMYEAWICEKCRYDYETKKEAEDCCIEPTENETKNNPTE